MQNLIEMSRISKAFGGNQALREVSLTLAPGSVHALMGENGAGKSTLMKILAGVYQPDSGDIFKNGHRIAFSNPRAALDFGISTVFQELSLLPNMSIAENMFLGREPRTRFGGIDHNRMREETRKALHRLSLDLDPKMLVSELSIAQRQFVEIAHGIDADADIFILDEPTAALNAADVEVLNKHIRELCSLGKAIVYISHRMDEIFNVCDTVTVLKDGRLVGTRPLSEMTPTSLIAMMVGRELSDLFPQRAKIVGAAAIELINFKIAARSRPFSLTVRKGEIVALAGLEGQGQQKVLRSLIGEYQPFSGNAVICGQNVRLPMRAKQGIRAMQRIGVGFVPEDRKDEGLFLGLPIEHNLTMTLHAGRNAYSLARSYKDVIATTIRTMNIKVADPGAVTGALSGGNQQKVLLGRYLAAKMNVLLIEEPTRGVDIGAKAEIYGLLREFAELGGAVLVLSRETLELIGLCDRICVIHGNTVVAEMAATDATEHNILDAALSA
ncbi:sugar ABC transporter ATP-binding protein [Ochrobactrum sp. RH2CCR150]|uniref:sugar ABC transporter ATP-binding protein n=1 Tax=Ochrobactrum sp. RH2CCR150 TaxID=2587044 RepID=UPI0015FBD4CE|nr:ribose transport system ATP-binding protein [Ochrobactrum sp. RH2CCR150]